MQGTADFAENAENADIRELASKVVIALPYPRKSVSSAVHYFNRLNIY
jgi:hypothetical protein